MCCIEGWHLRAYPSRCTVQATQISQWAHMAATMWAVLLLAAAPCAQGTGSAGSNADVELLLAFKASIDNAEETELASWSNATGPCSWGRIACNSAGRVSEM
jgi:hypothetical protein